LLVEAAGFASFHQVQLANAGYTVKLVSTAAAALGSAATFGPDLVVLDVDLFEGDGLEAARQLQSNTAVPVLLLVPAGGGGPPADPAPAPVDYLAKPLANTALIAGVNQRLRSAGGKPDGCSAERRQRAAQLAALGEARPA
jgi:DNA-binding response OmpR family regulator